jgi:hypothetical protein
MTLDEFMDRVAPDLNSGCWLWSIGQLDAYGYGRIYHDRKMQIAHRVSWMLHRGKIPNGLLVRHKCDIRACVNPAHLEIGTVADNNRDMVERGRQVELKGEANGRSKLTEDDVRSIRALYISRRGTLSQNALASRFGVAPSLIHRIIHRESWGHVA